MTVETQPSASAKTHGGLTDAQFWSDRQGRDGLLRIKPALPPWLKHVRHWLPKHPQPTCLEVGVVPGQMLLYLATQMGFHCTGIDFSPKLAQVRQAFENHRVHAEFIDADFFTWSPDNLYDVVYSCGFIEHFRDYENVVRRHWQWVAPGGIMILTVPVFSPFQAWIRRQTYTPQKMAEVLASHHLQIMNLPELRRVASNCPGGKLVTARYINEMNIWFKAGSPGINTTGQWLLPPVRSIAKLAKYLHWSSPLFSPEIMVAVVKTPC